MLNNPWGTVRFTDKVALITGGASGIGRATAKRLAAEGAHVIIADNNVPLANRAVSQIEADGGKASHIEVDLGGDEAVTACGQTVAERFPALHMLVNNAAILRHGRIEDGSWQENWDVETAVGLRGWVLMTQVLLPMLKKVNGAIVNISSEAGFLGRPGMWVYDAIKAGLVSVTRTMAQEFVGDGIRVNAVAPGWIVTEMHFGRDARPRRAKEGVGGDAKRRQHYETSRCTGGGGVRYRLPAEQRCLLHHGANYSR